MPKRRGEKAIVPVIENDTQAAVVAAIIRKKEAENDLFKFAKEYLPHYLEKETPEFHKEIYKLIISEKRLGIAAPRGFAKSTIVQGVFGLYCLLYGKSEDLLTVSSSGSLAEEWLRKIKIELETNEKIKNDFGFDLRWGEGISKKWTESHITIDDLNGRIINQLRAKGRGYQIRGFRPTRIICDDLEDDELVKSSEQRQKLSEWFKGALMGTISTEQQLAVIGTILHPLSLLKEIIEKDKEFVGWNTRKYKAFDKDGKSIWETKWSTEKLEEKKREVGMYAFEAEYMNTPIPSESVLIKPHHIKYYDKTPTQFIQKVMFLDPASSEKSSADESAVCVVGLTAEKEFYEIETISGRWGLWELTDKFFTMYEKHNPDQIGVEKVAFQEVLKAIFKKEAENRKILAFPLRQISVGTYSSRERREAKDKWTRLFKITNIFEDGNVFFRTKKLVEQLLLFPTGDHDDQMDAFVYCILMLNDFYKKGQVIKPKKERNPNEYRDPKHEIPLLVPQVTSDWRIS